MKLFVSVVVGAGMVMSGCGGRKHVSLPIAAVPGAAETGIASWYGAPYHGRRAANGEIYDMEKMTAAHRTLPFGTWIQVRNLSNEKTVNVRITDRGPFIDGRIVDLSHAAAAAIAMIGPGIAMVRIMVIDPPAVEIEASTALPAESPAQPAAGASVGQAAMVDAAGPSTAPSPAQPSPGTFAVQVGVFGDKHNAERVHALMEQRFGNARIVGNNRQPPQWRVLVGREETAEAAEQLASRIRVEPEIGSADAFVVKIYLDKETPDTL